jgi:hypothetical protein
MPSSLDKLIGRESQPFETDTHLRPLERTTDEQRLIAKSKITLGSPEPETDSSIILGGEEVTAEEYQRRKSEGTLVNSNGEIVSVQNPNRPLKNLKRKKD